jgi:hypothetical protein
VNKRDFKRIWKKFYKALCLEKKAREDFAKDPSKDSKKALAEADKAMSEVLSEYSAMEKSSK